MKTEIKMKRKKTLIYSCDDTETSLVNQFVITAAASEPEGNQRGKSLIGIKITL